MSVPDRRPGLLGRRVECDALDRLLESVRATQSRALVVRGENLTDEEVVAGISGAGIIERATPRTLWLGLRWQG